MSHFVLKVSPDYVALQFSFLDSFCIFDLLVQKNLFFLYLFDGWWTNCNVFAFFFFWKKLRSKKSKRLFLFPSLCTCTNVSPFWRRVHNSYTMLWKNWTAGEPGLNLPRCRLPKHTSLRFILGTSFFRDLLLVSCWVICWVILLQRRLGSSHQCFLPCPVAFRNTSLFFTGRTKKLKNMQRDFWNCWSDENTKKPEQGQSR